MINGLVDFPCRSFVSLTVVSRNLVHSFRFPRCCPARSRPPGLFSSTIRSLIPSNLSARFVASSIQPVSILPVPLARHSSIIRSCPSDFFPVLPIGFPSGSAPYTVSHRVDLDHTTPLSLFNNMVTMTVYSEVKRLYSSLQEMVSLRRRKRPAQIVRPHRTPSLPAKTPTYLTSLPLPVRPLQLQKRTHRPPRLHRRRVRPFPPPPLNHPLLPSLTTEPLTNQKQKTESPSSAKKQQPPA